MLGIAWLVAGCATWSADTPKSVSVALSASPFTPLGKQMTQVLDRLPSGQSALHPLTGGTEALAARLALIDQAERGIDLQYYIWRADECGAGLGAALWRAAERGVRVRLLLDDWGTALEDQMLRRLDAHPRIEVRLFNPVTLRHARWLGALFDYARINRRMHNKVLVADNQMAIVGGRNIGDEYFGRQSELDFADLDLLAAGPVVSEVSSAFDLYWNSGGAAPLQALIPASDGVAEQVPAWTPTDTGFWARVQGSRLAERLLAGTLTWVAGDARALYNLPDKSERAPAALRVDDISRYLAREVIDARREVLLVSAYFVPGSSGMVMLRRLRKQGVRVIVVTNSLAATDVPAVHSGYARYRKELLALGVELYEVRADAPRRGFWRRMLKGSGSSRVSLHAKTFVLDRRTTFVGSLNLDPRSFEINTEIGILVESPVLAETLVQGVERQLAESAYRVQWRDGGLHWTTRTAGRVVEYTQEPQAGLWLRFSTWMLSLLPLESQL